MPKVMIGVQARSTSSRLPGKSMALVDHITMTEHVLRACDESADHLNKRSNITDINCMVVLLVPHGDGLLHEYRRRMTVQGPEDDVLQRYVVAMSEYQPDYVVRVTGDCPSLAPALISKHIATAINHKLDYVSNVYEGARTYVDGYDVEVISKELMWWTAEQATAEHDREHVTTYCRRMRPSWAKYGAIVNHIDLSDIKLSVDTKQDLENARENKRQIAKKIKRLRDDRVDIFRF